MESDSGDGVTPALPRSSGAISSHRKLRKKETRQLRQKRFNDSLRQLADLILDSDGTRTDSVCPLLERAVEFLQSQTSAASKMSNGDDSILGMPESFFLSLFAAQIGLRACMCFPPQWAQSVR